jgi:phage tail sheath gpL-like
VADNITFLSIPEDWLVPGAKIEIDHSRAIRGLPAVSHKMLVLCQRLNTGTVQAGVLSKITRKEDGVNYYGRGSMGAQMIAAILKVNPYTELYGLSLDDNAAGAFASGTISITGAPTESGTLYLRVGGRSVPVGITAAQTPTQIATAIAAAINADLDGAVTAVGAVGVVTVTARHKGVEGNGIDIRTNYYQGEATPKGIVVAIVAMSGGTANPDVTAAITAMSTIAPYTIVMPWSDPANMALMEAELELRFNGMNMKQGHVFTFKSGSYSDLSTYGSARNSKQSSFLGLKGCPSLPWVNIAQFAGAVEFRGAIDPALPFKGLYLPDVMAPVETDQFSESERNLLLHDGCSTVTFDQGGNCHIEQVITTYQTNAFGMEDRSMLKLNSKWTADYMRFVFAYDVVATFPNHKLAGDDVLDRIQPGQKIATPKLIMNNSIIPTAMRLEKVGLLEDLDQFIKDLIVVRSDVDKNRVNAILPANLVNQFDVFAGAVQYIL